EQNYPFIQEVVNIRQGFYPQVDHFGFKPDLKGYFADPSFLEVFSFKLISGDPGSALADPFSIVLTEKTAEILFGKDDPMGKTVKTALGDFYVTGVIENPRETHLYFQVLTSTETYSKLHDENLENDWTNYRNNYIYVLLRENASPDQLESALAEVSGQASLFNPQKEVQAQSTILTGVVPRWNTSNAIGIGWDYLSLIFFLSIGLLVLLPAIFNYTNLSIARALKRAKEIGVRKVVGAEKQQIKAQFLVEAVLMVVIALIGSLLILSPMKKEFLSMIISAEVLNTDFNIYQITTFVAFAVMVGLIAGFFPAQYFARLTPIETIYGKVSGGKSDVSKFRKGLFIFQFVLSLFFITGVVTLVSEHRYVLNANFGFASDNILSVPFDGIDKKLILGELGNHPDVKGITSASDLPGTFITEKAEVTTNDVDTITVNQVFVGDHFVENMDIKYTWGSGELLNLSNSNTEYVLVNEQFLQSMAVFNVQKDSLRFKLADGTNCVITGIIEDFNFEPISELIRPVLLRHSVEKSQFALVTLNTG
ncbi:MAG: ABC transporter permease, partial [Cyclobacteriaceae bacterium]